RPQLRMQHQGSQVWPQPIAESRISVHPTIKLHFQSHTELHGLVGSRVQANGWQLPMIEVVRLQPRCIDPHAAPTLNAWGVVERNPQQSQPRRVYGAGHGRHENRVVRRDGLIEPVKTIEPQMAQPSAGKFLPGLVDVRSGCGGPTTVTCEIKRLLTESQASNLAIRVGNHDGDRERPWKPAGRRIHPRY